MGQEPRAGGPAALLPLGRQPANDTLIVLTSPHTGRVSDDRWGDDPFASVAPWDAKVSEAEYALGRYVDRTYFSKSFPIRAPSQDTGLPGRFVHKVFDGHSHERQTAAALRPPQGMTLSRPPFYGGAIALGGLGVVDASPSSAAESSASRPDSAALPR